MDLVRIYNYFSGDNVDDVTQHLDKMVEERCNSPDVENLRSDSLEVNYNMWYRVKENLINVLAPLIQILEPTKYHYCFALFLDPCYVMELTDIKSFHQSKHIDTKVLVQQMMPKFYEEIMAAELSVHPNTPEILVLNNEDYLYFNNNPKCIHSLSSEAILLDRIRAEFIIYQNMVAGTEITDDFDVMNWFQVQQMKFPMLTRFAYIIHYITPSQTENEIYFYLAVIYTASRRASLSVEMLSNLFFININSTSLGRNNTIDIFGGSLDAVADIVDEMESNPDSFVDASDTE